MTDDDEQRERNTGLGYPEEGPSGGGMPAGEHAENEAAPEPGSPRTSTEEDGDPGQATGNPKAAGG
jgi:hypothetical protein